MRSSGGGASMYVFFVRVSVVIVSGSGRCGDGGGERRWRELLADEDVILGLRTGEAEFDVCEDAG